MPEHLQTGKHSTRSIQPRLVLHFGRSFDRLTAPLTIALSAALTSTSSVTTVTAGHRSVRAPVEASVECLSTTVHLLPTDEQPVITSTSRHLFCRPLHFTDAFAGVQYRNQTAGFIGNFNAHVLVRAYGKFAPVKVYIVVRRTPPNRRRVAQIFRRVVVFQKIYAPNISPFPTICK